LASHQEEKDAMKHRFAPQVLSSSLASRPNAVALLCLFFTFVGGVGALGQTASELSQTKKLFVDSLGKSPEAIATRRELVRRLRKSRNIQVVPNAKAADAFIEGSAQIWTIGHVSLSPRSNTLTEPQLQGFLSLEVVGKDGQTLWSYLATPSRFPWGGVTSDLAAQMANKLLSALEEGSQPATSESIPARNSQAALKSAGATFPAPLYQKWFELFEKDYPGVRLSYDPVGSAEGIKLLRQKQIDFGASDMPLFHETVAETHQRFRQIPMVLGAVVPIYNLEHIHKNLNFTPEILAGIYLGKIKKWNDPMIRKANPGAPLPDAAIVVVHRSDGSGTTFVWTEYLSKVSPEWKAKVGSDTTVSWPVGVAAEHNEGVADAVQRTPNSIGYVEFIFAIQHELSFGAVQNPAGQFIRADISSVTEAARTSNDSDPNARVSITAAPGKTAYPIATYTWLLIPDQITGKDKKVALEELFRWMLTSGQRSCSALGYVPLPPVVAERALKSVDEIR
jgi:phosphate transport system substrate-binding protein